MRHTDIRKLIWSALLVVGLSTAGAVSPSFAQGTGDTTAARSAQTTDDRDDDGNGKWGWLGLLGLAGLLGLRRRDRDYDRDRAGVDTTRNRP